MVVIRSITLKETKLLPSAAVAQTEAPKPFPPAKIFVEIFETFGPAPFIILITGTLYGFRPRRRLRLFVVIWFIFWIAIMFYVVRRAGYLDGRHTLILQLLLHVLLALTFASVVPIAQRWQREKNPSRRQRFPAIPVAILLIIALTPAIVSLAFPPRADKRFLKQTAAWIREHAKPDTIICDYEQIVGYYADRPYAFWPGTPSAPTLEKIDDLRTPDHPHLLLTYRNIYGEQPTLTIGPYRAIKAFAGPRPQAHDLIVLYALPNDPVLATGPSTPLDSLPH